MDDSFGASGEFPLTDSDGFPLGDSVDFSLCDSGFPGGSTDGAIELEWGDAAKKTTTTESFTILALETVFDREMTGEFGRIGSMFDMNDEESLHAMCRLEWVESKLLESTDIIATRLSCGLPANPGTPLAKELDADKTYDCGVCWEPDLPAEECFALSCGHVMCVECWQTNIESCMNEYRPASIECAVPDCDLCLVGVGMIERLHPKHAERYKRVMAELFIRASRRFVFCVSPRCQYVLKRVSSFTNPQATCLCRKVFCFECRRLNLTENAEAHYPATCEQYKKWIHTTSGGMMNFRQKPCPNSKCGAPIIKCGCPSNNVVCDDKEYCPNQCCNHMNCPQCGFDFCWICLKAWKDHDDWYNCKFTLPEKQKNRTFINEQLEAFLKYQDYNGNYQGLMDGREWAIEAHQVLLDEEKTTLKENFLLMACEELAFCYHTLRNSYVSWYYNYHCTDSDAPRGGSSRTQDFFEHLRNELEQFTNRLSVIYEKDAKVQFLGGGDIDASVVETLISLTGTIHDYRMKLFDEDD